jgi:hypothetical protein
MKPTKRIAISLMALVLGGALIYLLVLASGQTKGPVALFFERAAEGVRYLEDRYIHDKRRFSAREEALVWMPRDMRGLRQPERILLGAFDNQAVNTFRPVFDLEEMFHTNFPLIHIYTAWGSKPEQRFPRKEVESIYRTGSLPVITWEPWLTDFDEKEFPGLRPRETRDQSGLKDIANGLYDTYIRAWAREAARQDRPIFLRLGHEMNDPYRYPWGPQNNKPEDFIAMWRHVHRIFIDEKAVNVLWIWSPHTAHGYFEYYFPGEAYVDWVGVGALNYGKVAAWSDWWSFKDIFGQHYDTLALFEKPIMLTEFGCLAVGGDRSAWYADALLHLDQRYPMVRSVLFFHYSDDRTTTMESLNWYVRHDSLVVRAITRGIASWQQE